MRLGTKDYQCTRHSVKSTHVIEILKCGLSKYFDDRIGKMIELLYLCNGSSTSRYPKMEKIVYTWFYQSKYDYYDDNIILCFWLLIVFIFYHSLLDYATNTEGACTISIRGTRARALGSSHANSLQASCWNSSTCTII